MEENKDASAEDSDFAVNFQALKSLCQNNAEYFSKDSSENGVKLYSTFTSIIEGLDALQPLVLKLQEVVSTYDFDEVTKGNGFRSFLEAVNKALVQSIQLNSRMCTKRDSVLFRKSLLTKDFESSSRLMFSLAACLRHLEKLISESTSGDLFISNYIRPDEFLTKTKDIDQCSFYGRNLGYQFCATMRPIIRFLGIALVLFSEAYYSDGSIISKATNSVTTTAKYLTDPEERARRIVNITQNADVDFIKSFWSLTEGELMNQVPTVVGQNVAISKIIQIPPEPLTITVDEKEVEIPIPESHIGKKPIQVRLISYEVREGMIGEAKNKNKPKPLSEGLLFHCHGGGFIAQSSKSHEGYLRQWAKDLQVPILSVDYSLAPQAPYPRALEEVTYAYCWALKNCQLLRSTGETIVAAGDSAGGNLVLGATFKCIELGIPPPSGLFLAYTPTWLSCVPSPSRLISFMDPMLPFGFMMRCMKAYLCPNMQESYISSNGDSTSDTESFEEISQSDLFELQAHKSPTSEASDTMTLGSLNSPLAEDDGQVFMAMDSQVDMNASSGLEQSGRQGSMPELLKKYVLDTDTDTEGNKTPVLKQESASTQAFENTLQSKVSSFVYNLRSRIGKWVTGQNSGASAILDSKNHSFAKLVPTTLPSDYFFSPYLASDELLKKLPPVRMLTTAMDPCLDDCVMFAKRLKNLNKSISLDVLTGLPHGFLNFSLLSKDAYDGSKKCINRIQEMLNQSQ